MLPSISRDEEERGSHGRRTDPVRHVVRAPEGSRPNGPGRPKSGGKRVVTEDCIDMSESDIAMLQEQNSCTPSAPSHASEMRTGVSRVRRLQAGRFICDSTKGQMFDLLSEQCREPQELLPFPPSVDRGVQETVEALKDLKFHIVDLGIDEETPHVVSTVRRGGTTQTENIFGFHKAQAFIILLQRRSSLKNACTFLQELRHREMRHKKQTFKGFPPVVTIMLRDGLELHNVQSMTEDLLQAGADIALVEPTIKTDLPALLASSLPSVRFLLDSKMSAVEHHANQLFWKDAPSLVPPSLKDKSKFQFPGLNATIKEIEATHNQLGGVGRHMFTKLLGCGGCGKVYVFEDTDGKKEVAKVIPKMHVKSREHARRILRECCFHKQVHEHPNIVTFNGFLHARRNLYIYMGFGGDMDLSQLMERCRLDSSSAQAIMTQVADAVCYCHKCKVAHRDLKPENVAVSASGVAMLLDFGLAISTEDLVTENCGTVPFGPPEVYRDHQYDPKSVDVWGLGVLLLHTVCGKYSLFHMMEYKKAPCPDKELADTLERFFNPDEFVPWHSKIKKWNPDIEISTRLLAAMKAAIVIEPKGRCSARNFLEHLGCESGVDRGVFEQAAPSSLPTPRLTMERCSLAAPSSLPTPRLTMERCAPDIN